MPCRPWVRSRAGRIPERTGTVLAVALPRRSSRLPALKEPQMLATLLLVSTFLSAIGPTEAGSKPDLATYEAARARAGQDADAQVKLALWCEAHGLSAERLKHLTLA